MKLAILFYILPLFHIIPPGEANDANDLVGIYYTSDKTGQIEIYIKNGKYFGRVLQGENIKQDIHNPDPSLRNRTTLGIDILKNFVFDGTYNWKGQVYNPENGKTYKAKIWLESENKRLKLRGYLGFFYKTVAWERIDQP